MTDLTARRAPREANGLGLRGSRRAPRRSFTTALAAVVLAAAVVVLGADPAAAAPPPAPTGVPATVVEAQDYASTAWADPWDYGNAEDFNVSEGYQTYQTYNLGMANGLLSFEVGSGSNFQPLTAWTGTQSYPRQGPPRPIDAALYTEISFSMYSSSSTTQYGGVFWSACDPFAPCVGAQSFALLPGWNVYRFHLAPNLVNVPWAGQVHRLQIVPTGETPSYVHVDVDWIRLHRQSNPNVSLSLTGSPSQVWWTTDGTTTPTASRTRGTLPISGSTAAFPSDAFPPGTYRFFTVRNGEVSPLSSPLTIGARPQPVVLDPDHRGGDDWATLARGGDAWDMNQLSDIAISANVSLVQGSGMVCGYGTGVMNDPVIVFNTNGLTIDAAQFHRLTYRIYYDPPFGLEDAPGGGMVARTMWSTSPGGRTEVGQDTVVTPGWQEISFDLTTNPLSLVEDETVPSPPGWGGPQSRTVHGLRLDPHEDPGGRRFCIDDVRLTRNDRGTPGLAIRYQDKAWKAGTTASIQVSSRADGANAVTIASGLAVTNGINTYTWNGGGGSAWYVKVVMTDGSGAVAEDVSMGPADMPPPPVNPSGAIDYAYPVVGGLRLGGWAVDPDQTPGQSLQVRATVDGVARPAVATTVVRDDVAAVYPGHGNQLGFDIITGATAGPHTVCVTVGNVGPGTDVALGCRAVQVLSGSPLASLDYVVQSAPGQISLGGWALDPDTFGPAQAHIYIDGVGIAIDANQPRPDLLGPYPGWGPNRGWSYTKAVGGGTHSVCVFAYNVAGGGISPLLGCRTITIASQPFGSLDSITRSGPNGTTLTVSGWAIDPDTNGPTQAHLYVGNAGYAIAAGNNRPDIGAAFPFYGPNHGFSASFTIPAGPQQACVFAYNLTGPGGSTLLTCRSI